MAQEQMGPLVPRFLQDSSQLWNTCLTGTLEVGRFSCSVVLYLWVCVCIFPNLAENVDL